MKISVIGCGYLGAVHAAAMAKVGHEVVGIDVDVSKVDRLNRADPPFYEPGLRELIHEQIGSGALRFSTDFAEARDSRVHFVSVGTPQSPGRMSADLRFVDSAIDSLLPQLAPGQLVVGKSTVPVGTFARLLPRVAQTGADLAWNPEFLREGFAIRDSVSPDRLVYGVVDSSAADILDDVFASALAAGVPRIVTDPATAELVKVSANAFLATKISFINAMAEMADATGADIVDLADALGYDDRIGRRFLRAGIGFGGGCLPKDIRAFRARAEELGLGEPFGFLREVDEINTRQRRRMADLAREQLGDAVHHARVAVLGVTFKPDSDDVRDSPALDVAVQLAGLGSHVVATDPRGIDNARSLQPQLGYAETAEEAMTGADLTILVTEWEDYRGLDPVRAAEWVSAPRIIDGRNALDPTAWTAAGWSYRGLGRS